MDKGPWTVLHNIAGKAVGVLSDDFKHDVLLRVDGDFATDLERATYCIWLRETLNGARAALAGDAKPEPRCVACEDNPQPPNVPCAVCGASPASAPHRIPEANDRSWLCFHCDERFTDREEARQHFGEMRTGVALCQEPRDVQDALRRARDAENRWMDVAAKLGVERTENERLAHMLASWERQFGTTDPREAWNRLDSMEGRALAAEERLSAPPPPAPATEGKP